MGDKNEEKDKNILFIIKFFNYLFIGGIFDKYF